MINLGANWNIKVNFRSHFFFYSYLMKFQQTQPTALFFLIIPRPKAHLYARTRRSKMNNNINSSRIFWFVPLFGLILFEFARNRRKSKVQYIRPTNSQPMKCVGKDRRAYGQLMTKFSRMGRLPHFLRYGATLTRAWCARGAPLLEVCKGKSYNTVYPQSLHA